MYETKNTSLKKSKNIISNESHKESKYINKEEQINIKPLQKKTSHQYDKNSNQLFISNKKNKIESFNIVNNNKNYKNIIINNMLTPNKKLLIKEKVSSKNKKNIKLERNILFDNKNFRTLVKNKQKSLNKNSALNLILNSKEPENLNDMEMKYKLILFEKKNMINKLKSEAEYYKNYYHNMNIILPNNNSNTIEVNRNNGISLGLNDKKDSEGENIRNRIKNIFSIQKKDLKFDNNYLMNNNIYDYNAIKTFINKINSDNINYNNSETTKDFIPQIKNNFNTIENNNNINLNKFNNNKLLLSNDSLKNDIINKKNNLENSNAKTLNNIFYRSNSNTIPKKGRKMKLGLQQNELNLDMNTNNYNSIETNRNYKNSLNNKKYIIYSLDMLNSKTGSETEFEYQNNSNKMTIENNTINRFRKNKHYFSNITSSPSSLDKYIGNKNTIEDNTKSLIGKNDGDLIFDYKTNFEKLKQRMNNLVNNLFYLIEIKNKKEQKEIKNENIK